MKKDKRVLRKTLRKLEEKFGILEKFVKISFRKMLKKFYDNLCGIVMKLFQQNLSFTDNSGEIFRKLYENFEKIVIENLKVRKFLGNFTSKYRGESL